jgi:hypothetical protein
MPDLVKTGPEMYATAARPFPCQRCGALVAEMSVHDHWHQVLDDYLEALWQRTKSTDA